MKKRIGVVDRLFPMPCTLVVGGTMEQADMLTVAWINVISSTPPTIAMGLRDSRRTLDLIRTNNTFTVNVPRTDMAAAVDFCGLTSGRTIDKIAATGLTLAPSAVVETPLIAECPYNIECRVTDEVVVGSYRVILGEILETHADEEVLAQADGDIVDIDALDPLVYIAGAREYRGVGPKVADAYSVGKALVADAG